MKLWNYLYGIFPFLLFLRCKGYTAQQDIIFTPLNFYDSFLRNVIQRDFLWHQFLPEYARVPRSVVLSSKVQLKKLKQFMLHNVQILWSTFINFIYISHFLTCHCRKMSDNHEMRTFVCLSSLPTLSAPHFMIIEENSGEFWKMFYDALHQGVSCNFLRLMVIGQSGSF